MHNSSPLTTQSKLIWIKAEERGGVVGHDYIFDSHDNNTELLLLNAQ